MKTTLPFITAIVTVSLVACAGTIPELEKAKVMYQTAAADPQVSKYAPADLKKADLALQNAESSFTTAEKRHQAYLTQRRIEIAYQQAERLSTVDKIQANNKTLAGAVDQKIKKVAALEDQLSELKSQRTGRGLEITLHDTIFETGKAQLKPNSRGTLDKIATVLREDPARQAIIEGHTDSTGTKEFNMKLSHDRAESVVNYLVSAGVNRSQLLLEGYGSEFPLSANDTEEGRQHNRRVEVVLTPSGEKAEKYLR